VIYESQTICQQRISSALTCFQDCNRLSPIECDLIETEVKDLIAKPSVREAAKNYSRKDRLDQFWRKILKTYECSKLLTDFIHSVLILSHRNSFVERGFSIKGEPHSWRNPTSSDVAARIFTCAPRRFHADSGAISRDNLLKIGREVKEGSIFMSDCFSKFLNDSFHTKIMCKVEEG